MKIRRRTSYALGVLTTVAALFLVGYVSAALYTTVDIGTSSGVDNTARYMGTNRLDFNGTTVSSITNDGVNQTVFNAAGIVIPAGVGFNITSTPRMDAIAELTAAAGVTIDGMLIKDGAILETVITDGSVLARLASSDKITGLWNFTHASGLLTNTIGESTSAAGVTIDGMLIKDGAILEAVITDGSVLARVASVETISGVWTFTALPQVNGGAFASVANITTHAALQTGVHGISITAGKTLTVSNSMTFTATDGSTLAIGTGGTLGTAAYTASTAYEASGGIATHAALTATHGVSGAIVGTTDTQTLSAKTLTAPVINGIVTTTGLTLPAFTLGGQVSGNGQDIISISKIKSATDSAIRFYGLRQAVADDHLDFYTTGATPTWTDTQRLKIGGGAATATVAWSNAIHTGLTLGGNLAVDGNNTRTEYAAALRAADGYFVNFHVLAGVTTGGLFEGNMKPVAGYTPQNGDVVVLVNGTHYARSSRVGETRPTTAVFVNTVKASESVDVVKTFEEPVTVDITERENITIIDVFGKKHIEVKENVVKEVITDRVWKNRTIKNERGETETITVFVDIPRTRNVTKTEKETVTRDTSESVLYIWEPNALVKVCGIVKAGDRLIAGENGCARTWGDLIAQKNPITIEALIDFMSKYSSFGIANEDSKDGYVRATVMVK